MTTLISSVPLAAESPQSSHSIDNTENVVPRPLPQVMLQVAHVRFVDTKRRRI
jgi:hypothetical protein